jgi:hypothetical protein
MTNSILQSAAAPNSKDPTKDLGFGACYLGFKSDSGLWLKLSIKTNV